MKFFQEAFFPKAILKELRKEATVYVLELLGKASKLNSP